MWLREQVGLAAQSSGVAVLFKTLRRLMVFCMGSNSPGLLMLGGRTCAMIIARQWKHRMQLDNNFSITIIIDAVLYDIKITHPKPDFVIILCNMDSF